MGNKMIIIGVHANSVGQVEGHLQDGSVWMQGCFSSLKDWMVKRWSCWQRGIGVHANGIGQVEGIEGRHLWDGSVWMQGHVSSLEDWILSKWMCNEVVFL